MNRSARQSTAPRMLDRATLDKFLYFGYVPRPMPSRRVFERLTRGLPVALPDDENALIDHAEALLDDIIGDIARQYADREIVVPISGGLDSRCILAMLMRHRPPERIHTVTIGTPGTLDFDLGNRVAKWAGTQHVAIDATQVPITVDALTEIAAKSDAPLRIMSFFMLHQALQAFPKDHVFLTGFLGGPLAGSHFPDDKDKTLDLGREYFIAKNRYNKTGVEIANEEFLFQDIWFYESSVMTPAEQMDLFIRQRNFILPLFRYGRRKCVHPFTERKWINFWISLDLKHRCGLSLYKKMIIRSFPEAFSLPVKNNGGYKLTASRVRTLSSVVRRGIQKVSRHFATSGASHVRPGVNYLDYELAFCSHCDLQEVTTVLLSRIEREEHLQHLEPMRLFHEHQAGEANHERALLALLGIGAFLIVQDRNGSRPSMNVRGVQAGDRDDARS